MGLNLNLNQETVSEAKPMEALAVESQTLVRDALALMKAQASGSVLVCRDGVLQGIFTERDALTLIASGEGLDDEIQKVMTQRPVTISSGDTVGAAIQKMSEGGYRRLPIVDSDGCPQGVLKTSNIVHYLVEHFPTAIYNLPPEPDPVMDQREGA